VGAFPALPRRKPGFPLQFLVPPAALLRDFHFNPLRGEKRSEQLTVSNEQLRRQAAAYANRYLRTLSSILTHRIFNRKVEKVEEVFIQTAQNLSRFSHSF
jgi:hypothetical protein